MIKFLVKLIKNISRKLVKLSVSYYKVFLYRIRLLIYKHLLVCKIMNNIDNKLIAKPEIIVSITTTSFRINYINEVIKSFCNQSLKPDKIFLYLSKDPYLKDKGVPLEDIPIFLKRSEKKNEISIVYTENIGPYRKLIPILKDQYKNNCVIITADDDTIYPYDWIEVLYAGYLNDPNKVVAHRCRIMSVQNKKLSSYSDWPLMLQNPGVQKDSKQEIKNESRDFHLFPTGKGGILYSPSFFSELVFDKIFLKLAPTNDDIWFKFMALINNVGVNCVKSRLNMHPSFFSIERSKISHLYDNNTSLGGVNNDQMIDNVVKYLEHEGLFNMQEYFK